MNDKAPWHGAPARRVSHVSQRRGLASVLCSADIRAGTKALEEAAVTASAWLTGRVSKRKRPRPVNSVVGLSRGGRWSRRRPST